MINLNTAAGPAAAGMPGSTAAAPAGDFFAVLASLVASATTEAGPDGSGVLLPGSPLLDGVEQSAVAELTAVLDAEPDAEPEGTVADEAPMALPAWPTAQALAALFAPSVTPTPPAGDEGTVADELVGADLDGDADLGVAGLDAADDVDAQLATAPEAATDGAVDGADGPDLPAAAATRERTTTPARSSAGIDGAGEAASTVDEPTGEAPRADTPAAAPAVRRPATTESRATGPQPSTDPVGDAAPTTGGRDADAPARERGAPTATAAGISRVLDALEQLELAPPPRQVTLELGDVRIRLALEDGAVRMQLLGEQRDAGRDFVRAANEALRERGFDLAGDPRGDGRRGEASDDQRPDLAPPRPGRGAGRGSTRPADPTTAGLRSGIRL